MDLIARAIHLLMAVYILLQSLLLHLYPVLLPSRMYHQVLLSDSMTCYDYASFFFSELLPQLSHVHLSRLFAAGVEALLLLPHFL
mmetsp:Transcript_12134/g.26242  ORF Transcript_12134/g.26242 Transcript_12134/m.26242 type:complete len:85 (-) Transcript_12134:447-701(-)